MLSVRGIGFLLTGLLLGGCTQSGTLAPVSDANFTIELDGALQK